MPDARLRALPARTAVDCPPSRAAALALVLIATSGCSGAPARRAHALPGLPPAAVAGSSQPADAAARAAALRSGRDVVRRYYAALDGLRRHMSTAPLTDLLAPGCPCQAQVRAVRTAIRRGERYTDRVRVISLLAHLDRPGLVDVVVCLDVTDGGLVDRAGQRLRAATTVRNLHRELLVRQIRGRWLIGQVIAV